MAMPVSVRKADDPMGGNKFAGAMFAAPMGILDPAERIATVRGIVLSLRVEPAVDSFSIVAPLLNRTPSGVGALVMRAGAAADVSASNVAGVSRASYLAGALVERVHGFGPLPGVAVMATMNSHSGHGLLRLQRRRQRGHRCAAHDPVPEGGAGRGSRTGSTSIATDAPVAGDLDCIHPQAGSPEAGPPEADAQGMTADTPRPPGVPLAPDVLVEQWADRLQVTRIDGRSLSYLDAGSGPTLLLIHGLGGSWHSWAANLEDLARDHRVLAVDLPGSGASDSAPRTGGLEPYAVALAELVRRLDCGPVVAVGHSLGGIVAQRLAARLGSQCVGLVLVAPAGPQLSRVRLDAVSLGLSLIRLVVTTPHLLDSLWKRPWIRDAVISNLAGPDGAVSEEYAHLLADGYGSSGFWGGLGASRRETQGPDLRTLWSRLSMPTLVLWGDDDKLLPPAVGRRLALEIPGAAYANGPGSGTDRWWSGRPRSTPGSAPSSEADCSCLREARPGIVLLVDVEVGPSTSTNASWNARSASSWHGWT